VWETTAAAGLSLSSLSATFAGDILIKAILQELGFALARHADPRRLHFGIYFVPFVWK
jgi:hypothetical protein